MMLPGPLAGTDVVILAGGFGTRLQGGASEKPKILASVGKETFLDFLLKWISAQGARRVILALGYKAESVKAHVAAHSYPSLDLIFSVEDVPLGTAGALRLAAQHVQSDPCLVLNGDSWIKADFGAFISAHKISNAALSLLCVAMEDASRYGTVDCENNNVITAFHEKKPGRGVISAGFYLFGKTALDRLVETPGPSLEKDFFEKRLDLKPHAFMAHGAFIDIGTPESLAQAPLVLPQA
jgi:NDP-sugar pyrophosphorylase family protein